MATLAPGALVSDPLAWFRQFLKQELAPYPGRVSLVARMVTAATIVMILSMTFRIPNGAVGAFYTLTISRESPRATVSAVKSIIAPLVLAAALVLSGAIFFVSDPRLRFLWVIAAFFTVFYALSAMKDYAAATGFGIIMVITVPLWDQHLSADQRVEGTLWAVGVLWGASLITMLLELLVAESPGSEVVRSIAERLETVEVLLAGYAADRQPDERSARNITRLAMVGTSRLRCILARSTYTAQYREQMGAALALSGRLVDLAANFEYVGISLDENDRRRIASLAGHIAAIRAALVSHRIPQRINVEGESRPSHAVPLLGEMETTASLIPQACVGFQSLSAYDIPPPVDKSSWALLVPDALTNPDHIKFGLKGCLAASLCYVAYNSLFWPEISFAAVTTPVFTALTTIGASHQKQSLRFAGAVVGGFGFGMGAQVFVLPYLDSIGGFTVLFVAVATIAAWIATSSTRISYFGVQIAFAFFVIHLSEFKMQTSLAVARDYVIGILLALSMMWLAFDRLWAAPAGLEMKRTFIANLRLLSELAREPLSEDMRIAISRTLALRETINSQFDKVRALADGVLFEFGPTRQQDLALRSRIRQWQPQLRTFLVIRNTLIKYRLVLPGFELPERVRQAQIEFDNELARMLDSMADRLEGKASTASQEFEVSVQRLEDAVRISRPEAAQTGLAANLETFLLMSQMIEKLIVSLDAGIV